MLFRQLGGYGFGAMLVFLAVLMLGFLYIWKKGGLEWE
jgi:NADH-quinone oxidoreductase subunit A